MPRTLQSGPSARASRKVALPQAVPPLSCLLLWLTLPELKNADWSWLHQHRSSWLQPIQLLLADCRLEERLERQLEPKGMAMPPLWLGLMRERQLPVLRLWPCGIARLSWPAPA